MTEYKEEQTDNVPDSLDISDDELMNMSDEDLAKLGTQEDESEETEATSEEEEEEEASEDSDSQEEDSKEDSGTDDSVEDGKSEEESEEEESQEDKESDDEGEEEAKDTSPLTPEVQSKLDAYAELFDNPIKANGVDIQIDSVENAKRLIQMGLGFSEKMQQIKPVRKVGKMLQDNDLLDEAKVNHLIDVSKGNPEAIAKLLKDHGIDPLDLKPEESTEYKPNTYNATDAQMDLNDVLQQLAGTESGQAIIDTVSTKWDSTSQAMMAERPEIFTALDSHKRSGHYDKVVAKMALDKALGKLDSSKSDLENYHATAEAMFGNQGEQKQEEQPQAKEEKPAEEQKPKQKPKAKSSTEDKKALSGRNQQQASKSVDIDTLAGLSDEEFEKQFAALNNL